MRLSRSIMHATLQCQILPHWSPSHRDSLIQNTQAEKMPDTPLKLGHSCLTQSWPMDQRGKKKIALDITGTYEEKLLHTIVFGWLRTFILDLCLPSTGKSGSIRQIRAISSQGQSWELMPTLWGWVRINRKYLSLQWCYYAAELTQPGITYFWSSCYMRQCLFCLSHF